MSNTETHIQLNVINNVNDKNERFNISCRKNRTIGNLKKDILKEINNCNYDIFMYHYGTGVLKKNYINVTDACIKDGDIILIGKEGMKLRNDDIKRKFIFSELSFEFNKIKNHKSIKDRTYFIHNCFCLILKNMHYLPHDNNKWNESLKEKIAEHKEKLPKYIKDKTLSKETKKVCKNFYTYLFYFEYKYKNGLLKK